MDTYSWDAGVALGCLIWDGDSNKAVTELIDRLAENCYRFVNNEGVISNNFFPSHSYSEVENKIASFKSTYSALVEQLTKNRFTVTSKIDMVRFQNLKNVLSKVDKKTAIKTLIRLESVFLGKWSSLKTNCNLTKYYPRVDHSHEKIMEPKFRKQGDLLNYSATIHYHNNKGDCIFITTDRADFGNLDLTTLGLPHKMPPIEFVQNY